MSRPYRTFSHGAALSFALFSTALACGSSAPSRIIEKRPPSPLTVSSIAGDWEPIRVEFPGQGGTATLYRTSGPAMMDSLTMRYTRAMVGNDPRAKLRFFRTFADAVNHHDSNLSAPLFLLTWELHIAGDSTAALTSVPSAASEIYRNIRVAVGVDSSVVLTGGAIDLRGHLSGDTVVITRIVHGGDAPMNRDDVKAYYARTQGSATRQKAYR